MILQIMLFLLVNHAIPQEGEKGIFEWLGLKEKDKLHRLVAGKYLKQLLTLHEQAGTLEVSKDQITILWRDVRYQRYANAGER